jgi:hypothetical protein
MSGVFRGGKFPLEQSLGVFADAMHKEFPRHMVRMPGKGGVAHNAIVPAFLRNEQRLCSIDLVFRLTESAIHFDIRAISIRADLARLR